MHASKGYGNGGPTAYSDRLVLRVQGTGIGNLSETTRHACAGLVVNRLGLLRLTGSRPCRPTYISWVNVPPKHWA